MTSADAFNAVGEQRRRDILEYLAAQERPVGDIVDALGLEQPSAASSSTGDASCTASRSGPSAHPDSDDGTTHPY
jgi:hypothetical protein